MSGDDVRGGGASGSGDPGGTGRREGAIAPAGRRAHAAPRSATSGALSAVVVVLVLVGVVLLAAQCGGGTAGAPTAGPPAAAAPAPAPSVPPRAPQAAAPPAAGPAVDPAIDPAARARLGEALRGTPVLFDGNGMAMRPGADATLDRIAAAAREAPGVALVVTGNTAPVDGDPAWCQRLSQMRADMVADRLRAAGVAPERLHSVGVSHMYPAPTWSASRRVEVTPG